MILQMQLVLFEDLTVIYEFFQAEEASETEVEQSYNQSLDLIEAL